jgi:hypothetical protein
MINQTKFRGYVLANTIRADAAVKYVNEHIKEQS